MNHNDDAYAAMLLTMALSPDREEYAHPLSVQEFRKLEQKVRETHLQRVGSLMKVDISGMMIYLGMSEEEGYRTYTLLNRGVQLGYALDNYMCEGIDVVTLYDGDYPARLTRRMGENAPVFFYRRGSEALLEQPAIAILGISGVKTTREVRDSVESLVQFAARAGYSVITGGELGVSRIAAGFAAQYGVPLVEVLGGDMHARVREADVSEWIESGRCTVLSLEHPDAMFTAIHAIARNRIVYALADAAFVFNTDGRRGEQDVLHSRLCDWVYAWDGFPANQALIARGAKPFREVQSMDLDKLSSHWSASRAQQLSIFDVL